MARLLIFLVALAFASPAVAQAIRPAGTSTVGPWEAVIWVKGRVVDYCTMSRAASAPEGVQYGFFIDAKEIIMGVDHVKWSFTPNAAPQPVLMVDKGGTHKLTAQAMSATRANIKLRRPVLDELQGAEHADVQIGDIKVRLPMDDFNAARVVLEICVQKLGKPYEPGR